MGLINNYGDFNFIQIFGVLFLILAFFVWFVPIVEIQSNEVMLSNVENPNFESGLVPVYSGSLRWWKNLYINIVIPVVGILITTGLVTIIIPIIFHLENISIPRRFRHKYQNVTLDEYFKPKDR
jgi:hypothetical protein